MHPVIQRVFYSFKTYSKPACTNLYNITYGCSNSLDENRHLLMLWSVRSFVIITCRLTKKILAMFGCVITIENVLYCIDFVHMLFRGFFLIKYFAWFKAHVGIKGGQGHFPLSGTNTMFETASAFYHLHVYIHVYDV
jgi:hypothetical protein